MTTTSIDVERAPGSREAWLASNRQGLMEALERVRRQIERAIDARHSTDTAGTSGDDSREPESGQFEIGDVERFVDRDSDGPP